MNIVVPLRFNKIWLRYIYICARHEQELLYKHFPITPLVFWETALLRTVGSSGLISPLKRGLRVHLWFASPLEAPYGGHVFIVMKKWQVDWCHCVFSSHIPHVRACQMCSSFIITNNMTPPTYPTIPQIEKSNDEPNEKKLNLFHQLLLKCVYHSIHPWLRNTSRKNPSPCPLLPTCWAPAFCCSKTKVHNLSYLMQPGMTMGWIVQHFPRESQGVTR